VDIGKNVKRLRKEQRYTQTEIARQCGVTPAAISAIEAGDFAPSTALLIKIARALGVEPGELLKEEPVPLAESLAELLARLGAKSQHLADPGLVKSLERASDSAVMRATRETQRELELLVPALKRLGAELEPDDDSYMRLNNILEEASKQVLAVNFFLRMRKGLEPKEVAVDFHKLTRELLAVAV
jgi:transcriptional regulator with XRE-family HTH domain